MIEDPEIVMILRKEEKLGLLQNGLQNIYDDSKNKTEENIDNEDFSQNFSDEEKQIENIEENKELPDEINVPENMEDLKKKYYDVLKKLKESNERYNSLAEYYETISNAVITLGKRDLFSDVSDIIFQLSPNGRITYINSAVEKMLGYNTSEMIGCDFSKLLSKEDWKKVKKQLLSRKMQKGLVDYEMNSFESMIISKDGKSIPVEINGKLVKQGEEVLGRKVKIRIQGSIRDITERKLAEAERIKHEQKLKEMNEELQQINQELNKTQKDLRVLNEDLEKKVVERTAEIKELLRHKEEFIGQLGHDLKSPLTPLVGLIPTIEAEEKDPKLKELLGVVNRNVAYMRDLVVKTLKLEKLNIPNLKLNFETIHLNELVERIIGNKEYYFKQKKLAVYNSISKDVVVNCDRLQLDELFDNLFTNAIKFSPEGGSIAINAKNERDHVKISFSDKGIGLTSEQIDHIFDEFYKVDPSRHDLESSGLGLPICRRIVEKHGGKIWVESPGLNKGTVFYFTLPLNNQ